MSPFNYKVATSGLGRRRPVPQLRQSLVAQGHDRREMTDAQSLAPGRRRRDDEHGARHVLRHERVHAAAREGVRLDPRADVVGDDDRPGADRGVVRDRRLHPGPARAAAGRGGRRPPLQPRLLSRQLHALAADVLPDRGRDRRHRQRLRLRHPDLGRIEVVSRQARPRHRPDGRRLRRRLGRVRPDRAVADRSRRLAQHVSDPLARSSS